MNLRAIPLWMVIIISLITDTSKAQTNFIPIENQFRSFENLNQSPTADLNNSSNRGLVLEYLSYELAFAIGSSITALSLMGGFMLLWTGHFLGLPLWVISGATALATPYFAARLMYEAGHKYHPEGTMKAAIISSYIGVVGIGSLLLFANNVNYNYSSQTETISAIGFFVLPGIVATAVYNNSPRKKNKNSDALLNLKNGGIKLGVPSMTISPKAFSPGDYFTQLKLMSVSF